MPIVFGGAVSVNAVAAFLSLKQGETASPLMWVGMAFVAVGIIMTAGNTPHGHSPAKTASASPDRENTPAIQDPDAAEESAGTGES